MNVDYTLRDTDWGAWGKIAVRPMLGLFAFFAVAAIVTDIVAKPAATWLVAQVVILGAIGYLLVTGAGPGAFAKRAAKNAAVALGPMSVAIAPEGVSERTTGGTNDRKWVAIRKVERTDDHVFFALKANNVVIVPRHAFASDAEFGEFADAAQDYYKRSRAAR